MKNIATDRGISRRGFIGTITGAAALSLIEFDHKALADSLPYASLSSDYTNRLCYNENPIGPSPAAVEMIKVQAKLAHRYPDWYAESLVAQLADRYNVSSGQVIAGCGGTEMLRLAAMVFTIPGHNVVSPTPTYSQFPDDAQIFGSTVRYASLDSQYRVDLQALRNRVNSSTTAVCITNPNNPTGTIVNHANLEAFVSDLPSGVVTIIDEAYLEYIDDPTYRSAIEMVRDGRDVVVIKTFSKVYGLAGARIGYAIGPSSRISSMRAKQIFATISRPSLEGAKAALDDQQHVEDTVSLARATKANCYSAFLMMGLEYIPSQASFFMVDVGTDAAYVLAELASRGIYVRSGWGMPNHLRVSTGTRDEMQIFINELRNVLQLPRLGLDPSRHRLAELFQCNPNPFNSSTTIRIYLPEGRQATLEIFDIQGRLVNRLVDGYIGLGEHSFVWNGSNSGGSSVASGTYFYRLSAGENVMTRKMILMK
jgi:histidinol-phosphate aminotransferase